MPHSHHHHDHGKDQTTGRLWISIGLNLMITLAEFIGGLISGSLALFSDALHNLSDTSSLVISLGARKIAKKRADKDKTFGYKRAEIIAAFINLITLVIISIFLIKAAVERFIDPHPVGGWVMLITAIIGVIGNFSVVFLLDSSAGNINIKSAYIHMLADGLASIGVLIAGILIITYQFYILDPIVTLLIAGYILWQSYQMLRETIDILMESTPEEIDVNEIIRRMHTVAGVQDIHHMHVWRLDENNTLLESHVVIHKKDADRIEHIKHDLKHLLHDEFDIYHSTLEFEWTPCEETVVIPHH
ncbi:MAG TPA: cation diffusion facilitator family transporter [Balneolaceae bacterium]|nr:cation diffusion facilitator family transporter [Balneolaceae bacterium]